MDALNALNSTPIPGLLVIAGILLVIWAIINIEFQIVSVKLPKPSTQRQRVVAGILGFAFLVAGIGLFLATRPAPPPGDATLTPTATDVIAETPTPTVSPTTISTATSVVPRRAEIGGNRGTIVNGRAEVWLYEGQPGEVLTIRVHADQPADTANASQRAARELLDTEVSLRQPDGTELAQNDDPEGDEVRSDSRIEAVELPAAGEFQIVVGSFDDATSGAYTLILQSDTRPASGLSDLAISYIYEPTEACEVIKEGAVFAKRTSTVRAQDVGPIACLRFTVEVVNLGTGSSGRFEMLIDVLDGDGEGAPVQVGGLQPGAAVPIDIEVYFYGEGTAALRVIADSEDTVPEVDESNNTRPFEVQVTYEG